MVLSARTREGANCITWGEGSMGETIPPIDTIATSDDDNPPWLNGKATNYDALRH